MPNKGYSGHQDRQYNLPSPRKSASVSDITAFSAFLALLVFFDSNFPGTLVPEYSLYGPTGLELRVYGPRIVGGVLRSSVLFQVIPYG
jgi:hypothetical protein